MTLSAISNGDLEKGERENGDFRERREKGEKGERKERKETERGEKGEKGEKGERKERKETKIIKNKNNRCVSRWRTTNHSAWRRSGITSFVTNIFFFL